MAVLDLRPFSAGVEVRSGGRPSDDRRALDSWMDIDCSSAFDEDDDDGWWGALDVVLFILLLLLLLLFITRGLRPSSFRSLFVSPIDKSITSSDIIVFIC